MNFANSREITLCVVILRKSRWILTSPLTVGKSLDSDLDCDFGRTWVCYGQLALVADALPNPSRLVNTDQAFPHASQKGETAYLSTMNLWLPEGVSRKLSPNYVKVKVLQVFPQDIYQTQLPSYLRIHDKSHVPYPQITLPATTIVFQTDHSLCSSRPILKVFPKANTRSRNSQRVVGDPKDSISWFTSSMLLLLQSGCKKRNSQTLKASFVTTSGTSPVQGADRRGESLVERSQRRIAPRRLVLKPLLSLLSFVLPPILFLFSFLFTFIYFPRHLLRQRQHDQQRCLKSTTSTPFHYKKGWTKPSCLFPLRLPPPLPVVEQDYSVKANEGFTGRNNITLQVGEIGEIEVEDVFAFVLDEDEKSWRARGHWG